MHITDGMLQKSYAVHCRRCGNYVTGLGSSAAEATSTLRKAGWAKMCDRWYCAACKNDGPEARDTEGAENG